MKTEKEAMQDLFRNSVRDAERSLITAEWCATKLGNLEHAEALGNIKHSLVWLAGADIEDTPDDELQRKLENAEAKESGRI